MQQYSQELIDGFGETVYVYTRAQAISDGVLFDVSEAANEMGFRVPVATTAAVWSDCVAWGAVDNDRQVTQDEHGRLWDVLWSAFNSARCARGRRCITFQHSRVPRDGRSVRPGQVTLSLAIGPGDSGEPVMTIAAEGEQ